MSKTAKLIVAVAVILSLPVLAFVFVSTWMAPPADLDLARDKASAAGLYRVTIAPETEPFDRAALHSWIATVKAPDGAPVDDAVIAIDGGMPQHGHGLPTAPAVTASLGEGRYRVEGVRFNMDGWWEIKLAIKAPQGEDTVTFNLQL